jgi:glucosylceramidase
MMNRLSVPITSIWLALSVAACSGSEPSSTAEQGGSGAIGSGGSPTGNTGGTPAGNTGGGPAGNTGGGPIGNTGGIAAGNTGGSPAGDTGGGPAGSTGGVAAGNTGGSPAGTTGGGPAGTTGGRSTGNTGGGPAGTTGGRSTGNTGGGPAGNTGGSPAGNTGGRSTGNTGGQAVTTGGAPNGGSGMATGGRATGGAAAGGATTGPLLITSAQNDYFNTTKQATVVTSGTVDLTVNDATKYQRWDGFGGTFNEMGWDALSVLTTAEITNALTLLFDPNNGANFVYGRLPMGASDYSTSWYTLDDGAVDYTMANFSISRDLQKLIPFIKAALQIRSDIHLWASPWVVPSWMMDSSSNMKSDSQTLTAHALYMARFVEEYAKQNLKIEAIHPQNEPGYARVHWTQANLITFMKTYLGPTFAQRNLTAEIWCGTMSADPADTNIALAAAADSAAMQYIKGFGVQWNPLAAVTTLAAKGSVMQTEHRCGNYNFTTDYWNQSQYSSSKAQNDHAYGEESWQLIRDWMVAGVNSYSAWNMVLDTIGKSLDGWPQDSLLVVDRTAKTLIKTAAYHVFRQYSQFILPGGTRIAVTGSGSAFTGINTKAWNALNAVAFKNADGSIVTQAYNKGSSTKTTIVKIGSAMYQFDIPAHGWATLRITP